MVPGVWKNVDPPELDTRPAAANVLKNGTETWQDFIMTPDGQIKSHNR
jgi:hypothetical protein